MIPTEAVRKQNDLAFKLILLVNLGLKLAKTKFQKIEDFECICDKKQRSAFQRTCFVVS